MQIQKCVITKPGLLANRTLSFSDRITIVHGRNDSGKSLLSRAMIDTLWGELGSKLLLNGSAWDDMYLEVFFNTRSGNYRFIRDSRKSFMIKKIDSLVERELFKKNHAPGAKPDPGRGRLIIDALGADNETARLFKKIDVDIFRNISFMPSPMEIPRDGSIDGRAFQWLTLDDKSNFYSIYQDITTNINKDGIDRGLDNYLLGEILRAETAVKDFDRKIKIMELRTAKIGRLRDEKKRRVEEIQSYQEEISRLRDDKAELNRILIEYHRMDELRKSLDSRKEDLRAEEERAAFYKRLSAETAEQFKQFMKFKETNIQNLKKIEDVYFDARDIYEAIETLNVKKSKETKRFRKLLLSVNACLVLLMAALYIYSADRIAILRFYKYYFSLILPLLSAAVTIAMSLVHLFSFRKKEIWKLMRDKEDIETRLKALLNENNITLDEYRLEIMYEFLVQYFEEYAEYTIRQGELAGMRKKLKDVDYLKNLKDEISRLEKDVEQMKSRIAMDLKIPAGGVQPEIDASFISNRILEINLRIKSLKEDIKSSEEIISQISREGSLGIDETEEKDYMLSEKTRAEENLGNLQNYKNAMALIIETMEDAIGNRREVQFSKLVKLTREKFHYLTDRQYAGSVDGEFIRGILSGKGAGDRLNPSIYYILLLSIKLAATFLLTEFNIILPLIIDEPFLFIDNTRVNRLKEILDDISAKRQIIIFTHNSDYRSWGRAIQL